MLIWSSCSFIGLWIMHRTLNNCEELQMLTSDLLNRTRLFIFLTVIALNFAFRNHLAVLFAILIVIVLSPLLLPSIIEFQREKRLKEEFIPILDQVILSMSAGKGFRLSFLLCLERQSKPVRWVLNEFVSALQYQKGTAELSKDPKISFYFRELACVDQTSHRSVERLKALRRRLIIERSFRQKSRQALLQVRFQSWMITVMYLLLLAYVHWEFGFRHHVILISGSAMLFLAGLTWVQRMGRKYQWKT